MMERRRREAAARVKQRRILHDVVTEGKNESKTEEATSNATTVQHHPPATAAPRRTKRDLLARSRRSLSEPHRRFASPPAQRSLNASSPRAMQHQEEPQEEVTKSKQEETAKVAVVDQRERRLLLKSKAKQMVSKRAKAVSVVTTTAAAAAAVQPQEQKTQEPPVAKKSNDTTDNPMKTLSSPRRIVDRKCSQAKLLSKAKSVMEQRKAKPMSSTSTEQTPPSTTVEELLMEPKPKQQSSPARTTDTVNNVSVSFLHKKAAQHKQQRELLRRKTPDQTLAQELTAILSGGSSEMSVPNPTAETMVPDDVKNDHDQIISDVASPLQPSEPLSMAKPMQSPLHASPKQDIMEKIRQDEAVSESRTIPPVQTCLLDKTSAIRLDSPEKKLPSLTFDLIEINSTEDEDRPIVSTTPPSLSVAKNAVGRDSPATEAAACPTYSPAGKDEKDETSSPELRTSDSLDEILATPKEMDFRPLPTSESAIVESSWDANKVLFNEYTNPDQRESSSSSWTKEILPKEEEESTPMVVAPVQDDDMDPLGWPRSPAGLETTTKRDFDSPQIDEEELNGQDDEDNLLLVNKSSSDDMDDDYLLATAKSKEQRIKEYEAREPDEESSLDDDESDESDDEEVEIGYVSQESESVDDELLHDELDETQKSMPRIFFPDEIAPAGSEDNPIQIPVVLDLSNTDLQPAETLSTDDLDSLLASTVGDGLSPRVLPDASPDPSLLPPPPPPPKEKKPVKEKKPAKTVPLLAPPPEEKLARWESSQGRSKHTSNKNVASLLENGSNRVSKQDDNDRHVLIQRNQEDVPQHAHKDKKENRRKSKSMHEDSCSKRFIFPKSGESPFDKTVKEDSVVLKYILDFLGDPVAVCRTKMLSKTCQLFVRRNEHTLMRDAVRLGGMNMNVRPYFWLWVTLEKAGGNDDDDVRSSQLRNLEKAGREGKWSHVIERDVSRAFGNLPPHKSGARLRTDSIVRALVSWGKSRVVKKGVRGSRDVPPRTEGYDSDEVSAAPTDTVSDWGGVTPVGSFGGSVDSENEERGPKQSNSRSKRHTPRTDEMALSGNTLSEDMKITLQHKLSFILHSLSAWNNQVGYCQGMDYIVSHLLRILQDTIRWKAANGTLPAIVENTPTLFGKRPLSRKALQEMYAEVDRSLVVEETCFRVMNAFFTTYSLEHFYWPELRCLKTCCRVFEKLIKIKLPVLHDHFEHHELNVGLFALGWFQTLFLYLPSMPSATVCHMWDIWLVERSFKIFFRVGTAILFLSQPQLLNCELDGMMSYLNTFPDATLLSPDILIACALQIKVTNTMLMELEEEVKRTTMTC